MSEGFAVLQGKQVLLIAVGILLVLVGSLLVLGIWLVRKFKKRLGKRAYFLPLIPVLVILGAGYAVLRLSGPNTGPPREVPGDKLEALVKQLPGYAPFGYSGLAYFRGKLYATSNLGLLEVEDNRVSKIYRVQEEYSVVSGPWVDSHHGLLWIRDDQTFELLMFDRSGWTRSRMPVPEKGYYSRGEALEGIGAVDSGSTMLIYAGGTPWWWDAQQHKWQMVRLPPLPSDQGVLIPMGILPLGNTQALIVRREVLSFLKKDEEPFNSDVILRFKDKWEEIPRENGLQFFAEKWVIVAGRGYICTRSGTVVEVTETQVKRLEGPGLCEALASTTSGTLLASFQKEGIYEYTAKWVQRAPHPYPSGKGEYWAYLAEHDGQIAYAMTPKPPRFAPSALWVLTDGKLAKVPAGQ